ncbi:hypothetical protein BC827DRAFT_1172174 [Russula dissimulans]|nr:hypothetical protein BC827DRAFT_1172174 [Russula dissimulans]
MSAVRRGDRRAARNQHSSPYSRSNAQPKKSVRLSRLHQLHLRLQIQSAHILLYIVVVIIGRSQLFKSIASQETVRGAGGEPFRRGRGFRREADH